MAQSLSDDEFQRMQDQLLELRTSNYQLRDHSRKLENELSQLKQTSAANEKELEKANKIISKSKKAKDVEALFAENDNLQLKLQSQEEDFRLQNSTLMEELSKLCTTNEQLEKEVIELKKGPGLREVVGGNSISSDSESEIRRLQAENAALQKNLSSTQQRYNDELNGMRQNVNMLTQACAGAEERYKRLLGERPTPTGGSGDPAELGETAEGDKMEEIPITTPDGLPEQSPVEAEIDSFLNEEFDAFIEDLKLSAVTSDFDEDFSEPKDPMAVLQGHAKQLKKRVSGALVRNMENLVRKVSKDEGGRSRGNSIAEPTDQSGDPQYAKLEEKMREISDLQLQVDTEQEENKILKEQLKEKEQSYQAEVVSLKEEIDKLSEKTKKKQESLIQLQNEKEQLYNENRKHVEELHGTKEKEIENLKKENDELKAALNRNKQIRTDALESSKQQIKQLEETVESLKKQVAHSEEVAKLEGEKTSLTNELASIRQAYANTAEEASRLQNMYTSTKNELESTQRQLEDLQLVEGKLTSENEELHGQFNECLTANAALGDKLREARQGLDKTQKELQESSKLAEKRKGMLDEMAIQMQTIREQHKEEVAGMETKHKEEINGLSDRLQEEKTKRKELEPLVDRVKQLEENVESLENTRGWFERRLQESEEELERTKEQHQVDTEALKDEHTHEILDLREELAERDLAVSKARDEVDQHVEIIKRMEQAAKDAVVDQKLGEKKRTHVVKDLQKQLKQEKKRVGKLQERLQEVLSSQGPQGLDALFSHHSYEDRPNRHDTGSVSSLSNSGTGRDYSELAPSPNDSMSAALSEETTELISKLTQIQQENWALEEKVRHLEESNSLMADDLLRKSAIIENHVMERKIIDPGKHSSPSADSRQESKGPSLNKLRELISGKDAEEGSQKEMNQKLQIMLEETITKNMHLQQDIEMLSSEVVRLSKLVGSSQSGTPSPVDDHRSRLPGATASSESPSHRRGVANLDKT